MTAIADIEPYLQDWRKRLRGNVLCVVLPGDADQVFAVVSAQDVFGTRLTAFELISGLPRSSFVLHISLPAISFTAKRCLARPKT